MQERVQRFLEECKQQEFAQNAAEQAEVLIGCGLYNREYAPRNRNTYSDQYPECEWNESSQTPMYFRKVPLRVTDEEYAEILKYVNTDKKRQKKKTNPIAILLRVFAVLLLAGGILLSLNSKIPLFSKNNEQRDALLRSSYYYSPSDYEELDEERAALWNELLIESAQWTFNSMVLFGLSELVKRTSIEKENK